MVPANTWKDEAGSSFVNLGNSLFGKTVGIVGLGGIGQAVAERLKAFKVEKILYNTRTRREQAEKDLGVEFKEFDDLVSGYMKSFMEE